METSSLLRTPQALQPRWPQVSCSIHYHKGVRGLAAIARRRQHGWRRRRPAVPPGGRRAVWVRLPRSAARSAGPSTRVAGSQWEPAAVSLESVWIHPGILRTRGGEWPATSHLLCYTSCLGHESPYLINSDLAVRLSSIRTWLFNNGNNWLLVGGGWRQLRRRSWADGGAGPTLASDLYYG